MVGSFFRRNGTEITKEEDAGIIATAYYSSNGKLLHVEPIHENVDDGFRTPDLSYITVQHEIISRLIHPAIPKRVLPELDLASRVDACLSVLLRKLKKI